MSQVFTGSYSYRFTSTGNPHFIKLPKGIDTVKVRNLTVEAAAGANTVCRSYWNKWTAQGVGIADIKTAATNALAPAALAANTGFFWADTSQNNLTAPVAVTGITGALPPVVTTGSTAGLIANTSIVRLQFTVGALQTAGIDYTVGTIVANTSFTLAHMPAIAAAAPGAGSYSIVPFNPIYYPSTRVITKMWNSSTLGACPAGATVLTLSVNHSYVIGQKLTLRIPSVTPLAFGTSTQYNNQVVTVIGTGVNDGTSTNTITVNFDSTGSTFVWPLTTDPRFTPAMVIPAGVDTTICKQYGVSQWEPRFHEGAETGILLMAGAMSPAGVNGDVILVEATKSYNE